jgi:hypothetical protein
MFSERFNTIFVHIPKTAGQSIEQVFLEKHGLDWEQREPLLLRANKEPRRGPERLAHLYAREYVECGHVPAAVFSGAFKFAVVRNPYDRLLSEYYYRSPRTRKNFRDFVESLSTDESERSDLSRHVAPQNRFVLGRDGELLVDAILRFESLAQDFRGVSQRVFGEVIDLPHRNRSERPAGAGIIDQESQRMIFKYFEQDFDLFQYPCALESSFGRSAPDDGASPGPQQPALRGTLPPGHKADPHGRHRSAQD